MENRVGSKIPTAQDVTKLIKDLQAVDARLSPFTINLTIEERKRSLKFRAGGEPVVALVGALVQEHGVSLPKISVEDMKADLELAQRLQPIATLLAQMLRTLDDTILEAQSECWWATTAYYTTLARLADADAKLQNAMRPAIDFFAHGPRATPTPRPAPAPAPEPSPSPTPGPVEAAVK